MMMGGGGGGRPQQKTLSVVVKVVSFWVVVVLLVFVGTRATTRAVSNWYIDGALPLGLSLGDDDDDAFSPATKTHIGDDFPVSTTTTTTTTMEFMRDGNEDEIDDTGRTAFETLRATENNHHHHVDEDDEDDEENDDRDDDDDDDKGERGGGPFGCSSKDHHRNDGKKITRASGTPRKTWAFKASSSLQYAHMPTHATHEDVVVLAFQGAKRSEGQANQRIYLVRSEDGGRTFDSRNPKKLNALVVQTVNGGEKISFFSEKDDAHVEAQWGPALFKDEEENGAGGKKGTIPLLRLYYSQSESCFFCRRRNNCGLDAKEYRAGGNLYETVSKDFGRTWSKPKMILKEKEKETTKGGHSPKVVANPPIRARLGVTLAPTRGGEKNTTIQPHLLLPYWTQKPRVGANGIKSACASEMHAKDGPRMLYSRDDGKSWHSLGGNAVRHADAHRKAPEIDRLLEGAVVSSNQKVVQFFRATRPRVYASLFDERKAEWGNPFPVRASNPSFSSSKLHHHGHRHRDDFLKMPNAKLHAISLPSSANDHQILLAHNDHPYSVRQRGNLVVQISNGVNSDKAGVAPFHKLLDIETRRGKREGEMVMYPHMTIAPNAVTCGRYLLTVSYSDHGRGIRFVAATLE